MSGAKVVAKQLEDGLIGVGKAFKDDLWSKQDLETLALLATNVAGLHEKLIAEDDPAKQGLYRETISQLLGHAQLLALSRINVAERDLRDGIGRLLGVAIRSVAKLVIGAVV